VVNKSGETSSLIASRWRAAKRDVSIRARDEQQNDADTTTRRDPRRELLIAIVALGVHLVGGMLFCIWHLKWSLADALYFCVVTITTVGYGDLTPSTPAAKLFFIAYILLSLTIIGSAINSVIGAILERQEDALQGLLVGNDTDLKAGRPSTKSVFLGLTAEEFATVASAGVVFLVIVLLGMLFFMKVEKLGLVDALYFIWITSTTVGFGDLTPKGPTSRLFSVLYLLVSTLGLANFIGAFADIQLQRRHRKLRERILRRKLNTADLKEMDQNSDQKLSKDEFLVAMLRRTDTVPQEDIDAILRRFDELDVDNDGFIDEREIQESSSEQ